MGPDQSILLAGTPEYMAPEQVAGQPSSEATDWYAFGVILYQCLTGRLPFEGSQRELFARKTRENPVRPSEIATGVPENLDQLAAVLLSPCAEERPCGDEILARLGRPALTNPAPPHTSMQLFVGREGELGTLQTRFADCRDGTARTLHIRGRSGMGRSMLIRRFLDGVRAAEPDSVILRGRCDERESVPYKGLDELIDEPARYLKRLPRSRVEGLLPREVLYLTRLFPSLLQVEAIAGFQGRIYAIQDAQELRQRAFVALRELLNVNELTTEESRELAAALLPLQSLASVAEQCADESGGHPLLIRELVHHRQRNPSVSDPQRRVTVREMIADRVGLLRPPARRLLEVVSVAGHPLSRSMAQEAALLERDEMLVEDLIEGNLLRRTASQTAEIEPYHDQVREAVVGALAIGERREYHKQLASLLRRAADVDPEKLLAHFEGAGDLPAARTCLVLPRLR